MKIKKIVFNMNYNSNNMFFELFKIQKINYIINMNEVVKIEI